MTFRYLFAVAGLCLAKLGGPNVAEATEEMAKLIQKLEGLPAEEEEEARNALLKMSREEL